MTSMLDRSVFFMTSLLYLLYISAVRKTCVLLPEVFSAEPKLNQSHLFAHPLIDFERSVKLLVGMSSHITGTQQLLALCDCRGQNRVDEHTTLKQQLPSKYRTHIITDEDRDNRRYRMADIVTQSLQFLPHPLTDLVDALDALWFLLHHMQCGQGCRGI